MSFLKIKRAHTITIDNDLSIGVSSKFLLLDEVLPPTPFRPFPSDSDPGPARALWHFRPRHRLLL
jgi:hypothetical protein